VKKEEHKKKKRQEPPCATRAAPLEEKSHKTRHQRERGGLGEKKRTAVWGWRIAYPGKRR